MIRPATAADLPQLCALEVRLFGAAAWTEEQLRAELDGPGRRVLVADEGSADGELVGYAVVMVAGEVADLLRVGVRPDRQRAGLATALTAAAGQEAVRAGARRLLLEVAEDNAAARALYAAVGFTRIDRRRRYYLDGSDALVLARDL